VQADELTKRVNKEREQNKRFVSSPPLIIQSHLRCLPFRPASSGGALVRIEPAPRQVVQQPTAAVLPAVVVLFLIVAVRRHRVPYTGREASSSSAGSATTRRHLRGVLPDLREHRVRVDRQREPDLRARFRPPGMLPGPEGPKKYFPQGISIVNISWAQGTFSY
jgi:hypothetical protein